MDNLELSPQALDTTATIIELYCKKQMSIMTEYLTLTSSLSSDWTDHETLGSLLEEINRLKNNVENIMSEILSVYPKFFREKAEQIRRRPKM